MGCVRLSAEKKMAARNRPLSTCFFSKVLHKPKFKLEEEANTQRKEKYIWLENFMNLARKLWLWRATEVFSWTFFYVSSFRTKNWIFSILLYFAWDYCMLWGVKRHISEERLFPRLPEAAGLSPCCCWNAVIFGKEEEKSILILDDLERWERYEMRKSYLYQKMSCSRRKFESNNCVSLCVIQGGDLSWKVDRKFHVSTF